MESSRRSSDANVVMVLICWQWGNEVVMPLPIAAEIESIMTVPGLRVGAPAARARRVWRIARGLCWPRRGLKSTEIAGQLGVTRPMVTKWRNRLAEHRLEG